MVRGDQVFVNLAHICDNRTRIFALHMCPKQEEAAHVREIRLLRGLLTPANQKIVDLEPSIVELREQHHLDVAPPLSTDADPISAIFLHELIANSSIDYSNPC
jgi:hypothetical protein